MYIGGLSTKLTEVYDELSHHTPRQKPDCNSCTRLHRSSWRGRKR